MADRPYWQRVEVRKGVHCNETTKQIQRPQICVSLQSLGSALDDLGTLITIEPQNDSSVVYYRPEPIKYPAVQVTLRQEPMEHIYLRFSVKNLYGVGNSHFEYDIDLDFNNNLHEFSQDYDYEILFNVTMRNPEVSRQGSLIDVNKNIWVSHKAPRIGRKINFSNQRFNSIESYSVHKPITYRFLIRRLNSKFNNLEQRLNSNRITLDKSVGQMLLTSGVYSDVSLIVGISRIEAHKHILSSRSRVFQAMFTHNMSENNKNEVIINEFDHGVISEVLHYIYTNKTKNLPKMLLEVLRAAHMYEIEGLQSICEEYLIFSVDCKNVVDILEIARLYGKETMKKSAMQFIKKYIAEMVIREDYQKLLCRDLNTDNVADVLKQCEEYSMPSVRSAAFEFVKKNNKYVSENKEFQSLFRTHPNLMMQIYLFVQQ